jgi:hypothetical protein
VLTATTAAAQKRYTVTIDSVPQGATIYLEDRDAGAQGTSPKQFKLQRGKYNFILEADGYEPLIREIQVARSQTFTLTLIRKPSPASLKVEAASGSGSADAPVKVNGKTVGKVPLTLTLQAGRYLIEVVKDGYQTWSEWVDVTAAEKRTLSVNLVRSASGLGTLLVSSNIIGAEVFVDGKRVDTAPALLEKLAPGKRTVEVRAKGYLVKQQEVAVEAGKTVKITVELQPDPQTIAASGGTVQVLASHKDVEITVDGKSVGKAPAKVEGLAEGSHVIEGRKSGMISAEQTVKVKKGELITIKLTLKESPPLRHTGAVRVVSPTLGATVYIDGTLAGKTPLLRDKLDVGPHFVSVRAAGHDEFVAPVEVKAGQIIEVKAVLARSASDEPGGGGKKLPRSIAVGPKPDTTIGQSSYGAQLVDPAYFTGDISLGFPHLIEGRLTAGIFQYKHIGLDGGVEFRTYGQVSEIGLHTKFRALYFSPFALAALFSIGGGGGPGSRNTFYANLGVVASVWFKKLVTFSGRAYVNFYSDRLCPGTPETDELSACRIPPVGVKQNVRDRAGGTRFILSAILEVPVHRRVSLFGLLEGAPFQANRLSYSDAYASYMPDSDWGLYFRIGATFKY